MLHLKRLSLRNWKAMLIFPYVWKVELPQNCHRIATPWNVWHKSPSNPHIKGFLPYTHPYISIIKRRTLRLLRLKQVKEITLLSTVTIYRLMKQDKFPKQIKLSERTSRWSENEIIEFIINKMNDRNRWFAMNGNLWKDVVSGHYVGFVDA